MSELPQAESADPDAVQMALQAAHTLWSRGETTESLRWLKRAAESASDEGADLRSLQLAKAAAELRAKLFGDTGGSAAALPGKALGSTPPGGSAEAAPASAHLRDGERPPSVAPPSGPGVASLTGSALRAEESSPGSVRPPGTQYVVHRPREAQRQLMGLSSTTLETAVQRNGSGPASVPSWSAGTEARRSSPPPLPHASLDDYEELDAEPDEDSDARTGAWGAASPPPLPNAAGLSGEDEADPMRPEQRTVLIPPKEEAPQYSASPAPSSDEFFAANQPAWDSPPVFGGPGVSRSSPWDSVAGTGSEGGWGGEERSASWTGFSASDASQALEPAPAKLTARVHHQAVRVSFVPDARNPGQYLVRPLREGERVQAGERVALLVALEPGVPLV